MLNWLSVKLLSSFLMAQTEASERLIRALDQSLRLGLRLRLTPRHVT